MNKPNIRFRKEGKDMNTAIENAYSHSMEQNRAATVPSDRTVLDLRRQR
jgi:hypothetical protein